MKRTSLIIWLAVLGTLWAIVNTVFCISWVAWDFRLGGFFQWQVLSELVYRLWAIEAGWVLGMLGLYWLWIRREQSPTGQANRQRLTDQ